MRHLRPALKRLSQAVIPSLRDFFSRPWPHTLRLGLFIVLFGTSAPTFGQQYVMSLTSTCNGGDVMLSPGIAPQPSGMRLGLCALVLRTDTNQILTGINITFELRNPTGGTWTLSAAQVTTNMCGHATNFLTVQGEGSVTVHASWRFSGPPRWPPPSCLGRRIGLAPRGAGSWRRPLASSSSG